MNDPNDLLKLFTEREVDPEYTSELINRIQSDSDEPLDEDILLKRVSKELYNDFKKCHHRPKVIFFIGTSGVGKTTTVGKVAAHLYLTQKKNVGAISTDTYRIAAKEPLQSFIKILEMPFSIIRVEDDSEELKKEIESFMNSNPEMGYLLVDTVPYCKQYEEAWLKYFDDLYNAFGENERDIRLVVPVNANYHEIVRVVDWFSKKYYYQYIFTKLDETDSYGLIYNLHRRTWNPIEYVTYGPDADDIACFDPDDLIKSLVYGKTYRKMGSIYKFL